MNIMIKRWNYFLIISGLIPLLFSIFLFKTYILDNRKSTLEQSQDIDSTPAFQKGDFIKFNAVVSGENEFVLEDFVLAAEESFLKGSSTKISQWKTEKTYYKPLILLTTSGKIIKVRVAENYSPCGDKQITKLIEPKKKRIIGFKKDMKVSGVGVILEKDPLVIDAGYSLCAGTLEEYEASIQNNNHLSLIVLLVIMIPCILLIYLGVARAEG